MKCTIFDNHNISELDPLKAAVFHACDTLTHDVMTRIQDSNYDWSLDYSIASCTIVSTDIVTVYVTLLSDRSDPVGHLTVKHTLMGGWEITTDLKRIAEQYFDTAMEYVIYDKLR